MALYVFAVQSTFALPPPQDLKQMNLSAQLIVIGRVEEKGSIILADKGEATGAVKELIVLRVLHVVKGNDLVTAGRHMRIETPRVATVEKGLQRMTTGVMPLKLAVGDVVVAYLEPSLHKGFFRPLAGGASVEVLPLKAGSVPK
jgi:hypothetical protein